MNKDNSNRSRRQSIIDNKIVNSKSVKIPNPHYVKEEIDKPKEKYSEYLIRMLEESPKKFRLRSQMSTFIKANNKFVTNKINFYPNKTNYKTKQKNIKILTERYSNNREENEISDVNKKNSIKDTYNTINTITEYTDRKKSIKKLINDKNNNENNKDNNKDNSNDNNNDNNKVNNKDNNKGDDSDNVDQLTSSKFNEDINNKGKQLNTIEVSNTNQILAVNNSYNTPNLMTKSTFKNDKNNIYNKTINNVNSVRNINRIRLNALYGYDKNFIKSKRYLKKNKLLIDLENYQDDILKVAQRNLSKDHLLKLYTELKSIKSNAEMVKPLPPINYPALIFHSCNEDKKDRRKNKSKMNFVNKKFQDLDDYEKELYKIKKSNEFKRAKIVRNKRLYKIYEILPEHVIDVLYKKRNKF